MRRLFGRGGGGAEALNDDDYLAAHGVPPPRPNPPVAAAPPAAPSAPTVAEMTDAEYLAAHGVPRPRRRPDDENSVPPPASGVAGEARAISKKRDKKDKIDKERSPRPKSRKERADADASSGMPSPVPEWAVVPPDAQPPPWDGGGGFANPRGGGCLAPPGGCLVPPGGVSTTSSPQGSHRESRRGKSKSRRKSRHAGGEDDVTSPEVGNAMPNGSAAFDATPCTPGFYGDPIGALGFGPCGHLANGQPPPQQTSYHLPDAQRTLYHLPDAHGQPPHQQTVNLQQDLPPQRTFVAAAYPGPPIHTFGEASYRDVVHHAPPSAPQVPHPAQHQAPTSDLAWAFSQPGVRSTGPVAQPSAQPLGAPSSVPPHATAAPPFGQPCRTSPPFSGSPPQPLAPTSGPPLPQQPVAPTSFGPGRDDSLSWAVPRSKPVSGRLEAALQAAFGPVASSAARGPVSQSAGQPLVGNAQQSSQTPEPGLPRQTDLSLDWARPRVSKPDPKQVAEIDLDWARPPKTAAPTRSPPLPPPVSPYVSESITPTPFEDPPIRAWQPTDSVCLDDERRHLSQDSNKPDRPREDGDPGIDRDRTFVQKLLDEIKKDLREELKEELRGMREAMAASAGAAVAGAVAAAAAVQSPKDMHFRSESVGAAGSFAARPTDGAAFAQEISFAGAPGSTCGSPQPTATRRRRGRSEGFDDPNESCSSLVQLENDIAASSRGAWDAPRSEPSPGTPGLEFEAANREASVSSPLLQESTEEKMTLEFYTGELEQYVEIFQRYNRNGVVSGEDGRSLFEESGLPTSELSVIWTMSDLDKDGCLSAVEFVCAMTLVARRRQGETLPPDMPLELMMNAQDALERISTSEEASPSAAGRQGFGRRGTVFFEEEDSSKPEAQQYASNGGSTNGKGSWALTDEELERFREIFVRDFDLKGTGYAGLWDTMEHIGRTYVLPAEEVTHVCRISDLDGDGRLSLPEFICALKLAVRCSGEGAALPAEVPNELLESLPPPPPPTPSVPEPRTVVISSASPMDTGGRTVFAKSIEVEHLLPPAFQPPTSGPLSPRSPQSPLSPQSQTAAVDAWGAAAVDVWDAAAWAGTSSPTSPVENRAGHSVAARGPSVPQQALPPVSPSSAAWAADSGGGWAPSDEELAAYRAIYEGLDPGGVGFVSSEVGPVLSQSGLPTAQLSTIWTLSDVDRDGCLNRGEFTIAMALIAACRRGASPPEALPLELMAFAHGGGDDGGVPAGNSDAGGHENDWSSSHSPSPWAMGENEVSGYQSMFAQRVDDGAGVLGPDVAKEILETSQLPPSELGQIWSLAKRRPESNLDLGEFVVMMALAARRYQGMPLPPMLPPELEVFLT